MKLRHLEIFYAVMTCGSLSRAAESLNISQPAASKALKSAELKLGFTHPVSAGARQVAADQRGDHTF